jgi:branched-chain amino acid transport system substrate-binding protein
VVAEGKLNASGVFVADTVLAKHDENYMPKEVADALKKARSTDSDALIAAFEGLEVQTPFGPIVYRAVDHQSTMGAYVGQLAKKNSKGVMVNWHYADGNAFLPPPAEARALRGQ